MKNWSVEQLKIKKKDILLIFTSNKYYYCRSSKLSEVNSVLFAGSESHIMKCTRCISQNTATQASRWMFTTWNPTYENKNRGQNQMY